MSDATSIAKPKTTLYSILLICFMSFVWAAMESLVRLIPATYSLYQVVWVRYTTHILFMLLVLGPRYRARLVHTHSLKLQFIRAFMMFVMPVSFILATSYTAAKSIMAIFWLSPIMIVGLSILLLNEHIGWPLWIAVFGGTAPILIFLRPNPWKMTFVGIILALAMCLSFSLYFVMTRMLREEDTLANLFYTAIGVLIPLSLGLPFFWVTPTLRNSLIMSSVGLFGFLLLLALDKALEMASASILAPFIFAQPVWIFMLTYLMRIIHI